MHFYILHSDSIGNYYVGHTNDISRRLLEHNSGHSKFTRIGKPWNIVKSINCSSHKEAIKLEMKIKKRGIKRYLEGNHTAHWLVPPEAGRLGVRISILQQRKEAVSILLLRRLQFIV